MSELPEKPSKTKLKQQMLEVQKLGELLLTLKPSQRVELSLPESVLLALDEYARVKGHEAKRRQCQWIGKLLRQVDYVSLNKTLYKRFRKGVALQTFDIPS